jgi:transcriptional regulator GlxA family with amidase domain
VLARSVRLSRWHLGHLFKNEVGDSPARYLRALRMRRAGVLLATTLLTVKEIRYRVGVRDQSHFARDFKSIYGLTPTEYRAAHAPAAGGEVAQQGAPISSTNRSTSTVEADAG